MDKYPVLYGGSPVGEVTAERFGADTDFFLRCTLPRQGLWCGWLVGEEGELRLGVLELQGKTALIRRRYSQRMHLPLGRLLRGEIRLLEQTVGNRSQEDWRVLNRPEQVFHSREILRQLAGKPGLLWKKERDRRIVAVPFEEDGSFPLTQMFCFAAVLTIRNRRYAVFSFDEKEWPVFPE